MPAMFQGSMLATLNVKLIAPNVSLAGWARQRHKIPAQDVFQNVARLYWSYAFRITVTVVKITITTIVAMIITIMVNSNKNCTYVYHIIL